MRVPPSTLVALGLAVAEDHDHKAAKAVGSSMDVERDTLAAAREVVELLAGYQIDTVHLDPDSLLAIAAELPQMCRHRGEVHRAALVTSAMANHALDRAEPPERSWRAAQVLRWGARLSALVLAVEARRQQWSAIVDVSLMVYAGLAMIDARAQGVTAVGSGLILVKEPIAEPTT